MKTALITLLLIGSCLVLLSEAKGRGGGSRGGSRSSSSRSSSSRRSSSSSKLSSYSYSRTSILTVMVLYTYGGGLGMGPYYSAPYRRYPREQPEYCVYCTNSTSNTTCLEEKRQVCQQSSDCYYMTYDLASEDGQVNSYVEKGCLYDPYGAAGCRNKTEECEARNGTDCTCNHCTTPYCNGASSHGIAAMVIAVVAGLLMWNI